jgi:hypothetical protein
MPSHQCQRKPDVGMLELYLSNSTNNTRGGHSLLLYAGEISGLDPKGWEYYCCVTATDGIGSGFCKWKCVVEEGRKE